MKLRILALFLALCMLFAIPVLAVPATGQGKLDLLKEVDKYITDYALQSDGVSHMPSVTAAQLEADPTLFDKLMNEMTDRLGDKYTHFYSKEVYDEYYPHGNGYIGLGISPVQSIPKGFVIADVLEDSSGEEAGLFGGDMIVSIDGVDITAMSFIDAYTKILGEEGTFVTLKVVRPGEKDFLTFKIERREFYVAHVYGYDVVTAKEKTGELIITQFDTEEDYLEFVHYLDYFAATGVKNLIVDLRGNPGGDIDILSNMLNDLIKGDSTKLYTLVYSGGEKDVYYTMGDSTWQPQKMVVLVDEYSASASEMFAGSLKDNKLATIVGAITYGKSRSQVHIPLSTGDKLVLTVSTIQLPTSGDYEGKGITPDYIVEPKTDHYIAPKGFVLAMNSSYAMIPGLTVSDRVLALEQRLLELGYFYDEPDSEFDWYSQQCVIAFQKAFNLTVTPAYVSVSMLKKLTAMMDELLKAQVYLVDYQYEKALELCGGRLAD